ALDAILADLAGLIFEDDRLFPGGPQNEVVAAGIARDGHFRGCNTLDPQRVGFQSVGRTMPVLDVCNAITPLPYVSVVAVSPDQHGVAGSGVKGIIAIKSVDGRAVAACLGFFLGEDLCFEICLRPHHSVSEDNPVDSPWKRKLRMIELPDQR